MTPPRKEPPPRTVHQAAELVRDVLKVAITADVDELAGAETWTLAEVMGGRNPKSALGELRDRSPVDFVYLRTRTGKTFTLTIQEADA